MGVRPKPTRVEPARNKHSCLIGPFVNCREKYFITLTPYCDKSTMLLIYLWLQHAQHNKIQHNDTQHNWTQHKGTKHNKTEHNKTEHNETEHNET